MLFEEFGQRWNVDLDLMADPGDSPTRYSLRRIPASARESIDDAAYRGEVDALRVRYIGRWGNYVIALTHLFHIAETTRAKRVFLVPTGIFPLPSPMEIRNVKIAATGLETPVGEYELEGQFFFPASLGAFLKDITPDVRSRLARIYVRPLMAIKESDENDDYDLVMHIRSGDIFLGRDGAGGTGLGGALYTQPPLSFYEMAADAAFAGRTGRVLIMSENSLNPTLFPLASVLERAGHSVAIRLNHDFNSDLGLLLNAPRIVFAAGTIGVAVAMLSGRLRHAYFFRHNSTGTFLPLEAYVPSHITAHYAVDDRQSRYIAVGDWQNTQQQREMMKSFPKHEISWEDDSYRAPVNIALNKPASQSSLSASSLPNESANAVNGQKTGSFAFHTDIEACPWWELDLEDDFIVREVRIYNRLDFSERANSLAIFVRGHREPWKLIHHQAGQAFGGIDGNPLTIRTNGERFRYLRAQLLEADYLHLDQVEVWI